MTLSKAFYLIRTPVPSYVKWSKARWHTNPKELQNGTILFHGWALKAVWWLCEFSSPARSVQFLPACCGSGPLILMKWKSRSVLINLSVRSPKLHSWASSLFLPCPLSPWQHIPLSDLFLYHSCISSFLLPLLCGTPHWPQSTPPKFRHPTDLFRGHAPHPSIRKPKWHLHNLSPVYLDGVNFVVCSLWGLSLKKNFFLVNLTLCSLISFLAPHFLWDTYSSDTALTWLSKLTS